MVENESTMTLGKCINVYEAVMAVMVDREPQANASIIGFVNAARAYLESCNTSGFERVCRGSKDWFSVHEVPYVFTDGLVERWYDSGIIHETYEYRNRLAQGLYESKYRSESLHVRCQYERGVYHGLYERRNHLGKLVDRILYIEGSERWSQL